MQLYHNFIVFWQQTKAVSDFPENLRQAMHEKRQKAADVAKGTGISPSVLSRYLSGRNKPSSDNILAISQYLNVTPEWLLSSSDAPKTIKKNQVISTATEPLLKQIELQDKLIKNLEKEVDRLEARVKRLEKPKGREKPINPAKPNKQKVGFLKKHKPPRK